MISRLALSALLCAMLASPVLAQRHADIVYLQQAKAKAAQAKALAAAKAKQEQAQQTPAQPAAAQATSGTSQ